MAETSREALIRAAVEAWDAPRAEAEAIADAALEYGVPIWQAAEILAHQRGESDVVVLDEDGRPLDPQPEPRSIFDDRPAS